MNKQSNLQEDFPTTSAETKEVLRKSKGISKKRKTGDLVKNIFTYLSAFLAIFVLGSVIVFVFNRGSKVLSWDMIKGDYWSGNYTVAFQENAKPSSYPAVFDLKEGSIYSNNYGIAVRDKKTSGGDQFVEVTYIDSASPFADTVNTTSGPDQGKPLVAKPGTHLQTLYYLTPEGKTGFMSVNSAQELVDTLDNEAASLQKLFFQTPGGGIRGSIQATLMLILVTLLLVLPLGVFTAIYLNELAPDNKRTSLMRSAIEMLSGVPSIIFGLMGMTVLFPITSWFGATTPNVLLGGFTMAIVLLPITIRQTEEALKAVPDSFRMGSLALGATKSQTIFKVILPSALPGILSAALMSISRTIGESAALIYTMGTAVSDNPSWLGGATTLAVHIWSAMSGEEPNVALSSAISILILVVVLILNVTVRLINRSLKRRWK